MSLHERSGSRDVDLLYSRWHRPDQIARYLPDMHPVLRDSLNQINLDVVMRCDRWAEYGCCWNPIALIETTFSRLQKVATVTERLARQAGLPSYVVHIIPTDDGDDIARFIVRKMTPEKREPREFAPREYAVWIASLHERHWGTCLECRRRIAKKRDATERRAA